VGSLLLDFLMVVSPFFPVERGANEKVGLHLVPLVWEALDSVDRWVLSTLSSDMRGFDTDN